MALLGTYRPRFAGGELVSPSGYGTALADQQVNSLSFAPTLQRYPRLYGAAGYSAPTGGSSWAGGGFAPTTSTVTNAGGGGLPLLTTSKSPGGNAALEAVLGRVSNLSNDPNQPLFTSTRDAGQAGRINAAGAQLDTTTGQANETLADFTKNFLSADPQAKQYMTEETGAIGKVYGGADSPDSMTATLQRLVRQRGQAVQGSLQRALATAARRGNLNSLGFGGGSSYNNQQFMDTAAGVLADEAQKEAELNRSNYLSTLDAQTRLAGQRGGLLNSYLTRNLTPLQAGQQLSASSLANLGALGNITNANRIQQTPEQLYAQRLGLLGSYAGDLNGLNIFGVGGNFPSPAMNWGNPMVRGGLAPGDYNFSNGQPFTNGSGGGAATVPVGGLPPAYANADPTTKQAALQYYLQSGVWPNQDSSYSSDLWNWARTTAGGGPLAARPTVNAPFQYDQSGRVIDPITGAPLPNAVVSGLGPSDYNS